jgi:predicted O-methyltransferase YrrM
VSSRQPFAERDYYRDPRRRAKSLAVRVASRVARPLGVDVELRHWYSPVPQVDAIDPAFWDRPSAMPGTPGFDVPAMLAFAETELADALAEFRPPRAWSGRQNEFFLDNGLFQGGDADVLYAMVRRFLPARIIELGAGFSTLVTALACAANQHDGHESTFVACDPYAVPPSAGAIAGLTELRSVRAEDVPTAEFALLGRDDVLFIDSSHAVRIGGDVTYLFTEVLPRLAPGVLVHVHDIFLPWPYPRDWIAHNRWYWAEQYLLQAFLAFNDRFRVLWAGHAVHRAQPARLAQLVPNYSPRVAPLSLWMRVEG